MLTVDDANEAKCEKKPEMNHPAVYVAFVRERVHVHMCPNEQPAAYTVRSSV